MKKISFLLILLIGLSTSGFSQSKKAFQKIEKKATELVDKLNKEIIKGGESLALSNEQKEKVAKIHLERIVAYRKLDKEASKEDKKKLNKPYYSKIFKVLTKDQMKARKKGKKK
jgi:hypothetical protein